MLVDRVSLHPHGTALELAGQCPAGGVAEGLAMLRRVDPQEPDPPGLPPFVEAGDGITVVDGFDPPQRPTSRISQWTHGNRDSSHRRHDGRHGQVHRASPPREPAGRGRQTKTLATIAHVADCSPRGQAASIRAVCRARELPPASRWAAYSESHSGLSADLVVVARCSQFVGIGIGDADCLVTEIGIFLLAHQRQE